MTLRRSLEELNYTPLQACNDLRAVLRVVEFADTIADKVDYATNWRMRGGMPRGIVYYMTFDNFVLPLDLHRDDPAVEDIDELQELIDRSWLKKVWRVKKLVKRVVESDAVGVRNAVYYDEALEKWTQRSLKFCYDQIAALDEPSGSALSEKNALVLDTVDYRILNVMSKRPNEALTQTQWKNQFNKAGFKVSERSFSARATRLRAADYIQYMKAQGGGRGRQKCTITPSGMKLVENWEDPYPEELGPA